MKNPIKTLIAIAALGGFALSAAAQPAAKILVVDMAKLYDNHWKAIEYHAKLQADDQKAQEDVGKMNTEGDALIADYRTTAEQVNNPALSAEAKGKAQAEAQKKYDAITQKQRQVQQFIAETRQILQTRLSNFRGVMLEEISKTATDIAKRKGATIVLDKAGPSQYGISNILYFDAGYDITDEVMKELNKDRPAGAATTPLSATPPAGAPGAAPAPAAPAPAPSGSPSISVPLPSTK